MGRGSVACETRNGERGEGAEGEGVEVEGVEGENDGDGWEVG